MRIHIHNPVGTPFPLISAAEWQGAIDRAPHHAGHQISFGSTEAEARAALEQAEILVTADPAARRWLAPAPPHLRMFYLNLAGVDLIAPFDWLPESVALLNNRGTHALKASEYCIMAVLMLANRLPILVAQQNAGLWKKVTGGSLHGQRLTVVGVGAIGGAAAAHARHFGMVVTGVRTSTDAHPDCDQVVSYADLDAVLGQTDILLLACPLTDATRNLLSRERLAKLPAHAGVINVGRGGLLDQDALCDALDAGTLGGAVLDVFTPEPVPAGHRLWTTRNLVMTPHMSADDPKIYNARSLDILLRNLEALAAGQRLPNQVDPVKGY